jgi:crescentin
MRFEALQARAATTERLLDEARHGLTSRSEELRAYERRMAEANLMRNVIESKLGQIEAGLSERDARIRDLENARNTLLERNDVLGKAVSTRENAYNRAQEKIGGLEERMQVLEAELKANREGAEMQIEDLSTQLQREHVERTMAEGALESARKDVSRLMRELATLQQRPVPSGYTATAPSTPSSSSSDRLPPAPRLQSVA